MTKLVIFVSTLFLFLITLYVGFSVIGFLWFLLTDQDEPKQGFFFLGLKTVTTSIAIFVALSILGEALGLILRRWL